MGKKKQGAFNVGVDAVVKNAETDIVEFAEKYMTYKISPLQETIVEIIMAQKGKVVLPNYRRSYHKKNELTNYALRIMEVGQTFALASPDGIRVYKMIEFKPAFLNGDNI